MAQVKPIPDGYHTIIPYLSIKGAAEAIEFYKKAFGATESLRLAQPDGRIGHAELKVGDSRIMLADEFPEMDFRSPLSMGGSPVHIHLYVEGVDAVVGCGTVADPFGHVWHVATHTEDVPADELGKRAAAQHKG